MQTNSKKRWQYFLGIVAFMGLIIISLQSFTICDSAKRPQKNLKNAEAKNAGTLNWLSWNELEQKMQANPKQVLIHVYAPWCGYCKRMEQTTYTDKDVVNYLNEHFYVVKFNAENRQKIRFNGTEYIYNANYSKRRNGVHNLAIELMNNELLYPSAIILDNNYSPLHIQRGFMGSENLMQILHRLSML